MVSPQSHIVAGAIHSTSSDSSVGTSCGSSLIGVGSSEMLLAQCKMTRIGMSPDKELSCENSAEVGPLLPVLRRLDYYMEPCLKDLAARELVDPGYCSRVPDFTVGRYGYGLVKFLGETDVRGLELDRIVKFNRHEVVVYEDESNKPAIGQGLNRAAEVNLTLQIRSFDICKWNVDNVAKILKMSVERQGARFLLFDSVNCEWKFSVCHFSRFGLSEDDEEDIVMDDFVEVENPVEMHDSEIPNIDEETQVEPESSGPMLYHSLPAHLGLDPVKMKEMKMLMFPADEDEEVEDINGPSHHKMSHRKEYIRPPLSNSTQKRSHMSSFSGPRKKPLALLEYKYNPGSSDSNSSGAILMVQQKKGLPLRLLGGEGFNLKLGSETPVTQNHSRNIVDAGLFMGRSFRVGWGPNGVLVHSGTPVGTSDTQRALSSVIYLEKVAIDKVVRDENNKTRKELIDFAFDAPLNLHKEINHEIEEVEVGSFKLKLQKVVSNRLMLPDICRSYIDIIERKLEVPGLSYSTRLVLMHQVMIWELIKVLFSERESSGQTKSLDADNEEDMMRDMTEGSPEADQEALPLIRRAEFSFWLQESVRHCVQGEVSSLDEPSYLEHIFILLTGRQLDAAVELAATKGDVRLACLLSQAGGSTVNRDDIERQLDLWRMNGLDFNFIEKERIRLLELLAGSILDATRDVKIDWKRFLGLLMWYRLAPDTPLPVIFQTYQRLLDAGKVPYPLPIYIDEGPAEEVMISSGKHFDLSYYLMLLHAHREGEFSFLKTMFSAFSSTNDPLDYHMIWHQRALLEAVGVFHSNDLQVLDMGLVSQLLCLGQCHWAIYVVLHMPYCDDYPYLHASLTQEILFQYCETWSSDEAQRQFIENLDIPHSWVHEAMAVYFNYQGNLEEALEHFLLCANWQKAHSIFLTSVAPSLFLSGNHSEIWRLATSMENYRSEIENWDLGAGLYITFYSSRSSLQEDNNAMSEMSSVEDKNFACRNFLGNLNEALAVLCDRLPLNARVAYSKMAEEISGLLLSAVTEGSTRESQLECFKTVFSTPIPEDLRSNHLQDAVFLFTCYLSETAS